MKVGKVSMPSETSFLQCVWLFQDQIRSASIFATPRLGKDFVVHFMFIGVLALPGCRGSITSSRNTKPEPRQKGCLRAVPLTLQGVASCVGVQQLMQACQQGLALVVNITHPSSGMLRSPQSICVPFRCPGIDSNSEVWHGMQAKAESHHCSQ